MQPRRPDSSTIRLPFVLEPAAGTLPAGIAVCPMNDAPFRAPFILPPECHLVPVSQVGYSRRDIDVVGDEQGLPGAELQDEALMPAPIIVVAKYPLDYAQAFDLKVAGVVFEGATKDWVAFGERSALRACCLRGAADNGNPK